MHIKERLGPSWKDLFAPLDERHQHELAKQIIQQEMSRYYHDDSKPLLANDVKQALIELRKFFAGGPLRGLEKEYDIPKSNVPLIDESIPNAEEVQGIIREK